MHALLLQRGRKGAFGCGSFGQLTGRRTCLNGCQHRGRQAADMAVAACAAPLAVRVLPQPALVVAAAVGWHLRRYTVQR